MPKIKKRRNYGKLITRLVLIVVVFSVASTFYDQHKEMQHLLEYESSLEQEFDTLQNDVNSLKGQIEYSEDEEYIEKIARERLKMVKENEILFIDISSQQDS